MPCTADSDAAPANPCCAMCVNKRIRIVLVTHLYTLLPFLLLLEFPSSDFLYCHSFLFFFSSFDVTFCCRFPFSFICYLRNFFSFKFFLHLFQVCCPRTLAIFAAMRQYAIRISVLSVFLPPSCFASFHVLQYISLLFHSSFPVSIVRIISSLRSSARDMLA